MATMVNVKTFLMEGVASGESTMVEKSKKVLALL